MATLSDLQPLEYVYCTQGDVEAELSINGVELRLDDDLSGTVSATELANLVTALIGWATARVNLFLLGRYDAAQLAQSWVVNDITTIFVCYRLCRRRGNPAPSSIVELYQEAKELLQSLKESKLSLEDVAERTSGAPMWRNIHHSRHLLRRNRVQEPISEQTRPDRPITTDLPAKFAGPEVYWLS